MIRNMRAMVFLFLSLFLTTCVKSEPDYPILNGGICRHDIDWENSKLYFCSEILPGSADVLAHLLERHRFDEIVINSPGGRGNDALKIALLMLKHNIKLRITGQCLSACAQYFIPAASSVSIDEGSFVAIHHTVTSTILVLENNNQAERLIESLSPLSQREVELYDTLEVDQDLLFEGSLRQKFLCSDPSIDYNESDPHGTLLRRKYDFDYWALDIEFIKNEMNKNVTGSTLSSQEDYDRYVGDLKNRVRMRYRVNFDPFTGYSENTLTDIPDC